MKKFKFLEDIKISFEKLNNARILVTGAGGLIASNFVEMLMEISDEYKLNVQMYVLCRNREKAEIRFVDYKERLDFHFLIQDVVDDIDENLNFDYIVHAASMAYPEAFNTVPADVMKANFIGTVKLLDRALKTKNSRFLFVSSSEIYGENEERKPIFSEDMTEPINFTRFRACYPESKRASETMCFCYAKQYDQDFVIVRPAFIFGKELSPTNTRADAYFMNQALKKENIVMFSRGEQIRSYLYVKDCASAMLIAMLRGEKEGIYNIGDESCEVTMAEYAKLLAKHSGIEVCFCCDDVPENKVFLKTTKLILDTSKLRSLGWRPCYSLEDGIIDSLSEGL